MKKYTGKNYFHLLLTGLICVCLPACNNTIEAKVVKQAKTEKAVILNDTTQVQTNITDFLKWYKANYTKANAFPLLTKDKAGNFMVNKTAYNDYLNFLCSSHFIAPRYIGYWETFFKDKEKELKKDTIKSDIPEGFDLDLVLITQEPEIILNKIDSIRFNITSMSDSVALVGLKLPSDSSVEYEFEMYKTTNGWQIGYISTPNFD